MLQTRHLLFLLLLKTTISAFPQDGKMSMSTITNSTMTDRWDLNRYVWSHRRFLPGKKDKPLIDFEAIDNWPTFNNQKLTVSPDGKYFSYYIETYWQRKPDTLVV